MNKKSADSESNTIPEPRIHYSDCDSSIEALVLNTAKLSYAAKEKHDLQYWYH
jgi:hypothetical protein